MAAATLPERVAELEGWAAAHDQLDAEDREELDQLEVRVARIEDAIIATPRRALLGGSVGSSVGAVLLWLLNLLADRLQG